MNSLLVPVLSSCYPFLVSKGLDALDRKILFELDCNSRQSHSELARKVRQGRDRVEDRVERLVDQGYIRSFNAVINLYKMGLTIYKTYFRLKNDRKRVQEFRAFLNSSPFVYRVASYDGSWDLNVATAARSPRDFASAHTEMVSRFEDIVIDYQMYTLIDVWRFRKGYFVGKTSSGALTGGEPERNQVDRLEYEILKQLAVNARIPFADLAEKLKCSPAVVSHRIEQLEKSGLIAGYRIEVDHEKLGMMHFKTQLSTSSTQPRLAKKFFEACQSNPHVTYFIHQLGECPLEIELEVESLSQFHEILDSLREEFHSYLQNFRSMLIREEYFKWLPQNLAIEN